MLTHSSRSRTEELLREFIGLEARSVYLGKVGENAKFAFVANGRLTKETNRLIPNFKDLVDELKGLVVTLIHEDESEWVGQFPLLFQEQTFWVEVHWFRSKTGDGVSIFLFGRWLGFNDLGLSASDAATLDELISFPSGVIVGCGGGHDGHSTTYKALLERLVQNGRRVASFNWSDPRLNGVAQFDIKEDGFFEQVAAVANDFDVIALGCINRLRNRESIDLAACGHLVLGLIYGSYNTPPIFGVLGHGASPDEIRAHFLGGWSQALIKRANGQERIGLFNCMSRAQALNLVIDTDWPDFSASHIEQRQGLWRDAEEKIAAGLITREDAEKRLFPSA